jgi:hypothetical protein
LTTVKPCRGGIEIETRRPAAGDVRRRIARLVIFDSYQGSRLIAGAALIIPPHAGAVRHDGRIKPLVDTAAGARSWAVQLTGPV